MIRSLFRSVDGGLVIFVAVALVALATIGLGLTNAFHVDEVTCTVTDKDRTTKSEGGSDMRVYTSDCGTLSVADSILDGHFSSSDTYASIEPGDTYTFTTRGYRIPILSVFPNIVEVNG